MGGGAGEGDRSWWRGVGERRPQRTPHVPPVPPSLSCSALESPTQKSAWGEGGGSDQDRRRGRGGTVHSGLPTSPLCGHRCPALPSSPQRRSLRGAGAVGATGIGGGGWGSNVRSGLPTFPLYRHRCPAPPSNPRRKSLREARAAGATRIGGGGWGHSVHSGLPAFPLGRHRCPASPSNPRRISLRGAGACDDARVATRMNNRGTPTEGASAPALTTGRDNVPWMSHILASRAC